MQKPEQVTNLRFGQRGQDSVWHQTLWKLGISSTIEIGVDYIMGKKMLSHEYEAKSCEVKIGSYVRVMEIGIRSFWSARFVLFCFGIHGTAVILGASCVAQTREWTNHAGRSFRGDLIKIDGETVVIRRTIDQKEFRVAVSSLSETDIAFVKDSANGKEESRPKSISGEPMSPKLYAKVREFLASHLKRQFVRSPIFQGVRRNAGDGMFAAMAIHEQLDSSKEDAIENLARTLTNNNLDRPGVLLFLEPEDQSQTRERITQILGPPLAEKSDTFSTRTRGTIVSSDTRDVRRAKVSWLTYGCIEIGLADSESQVNGIVKLKCQHFVAEENLHAAMNPEASSK